VRARLGQVVVEGSVNGANFGDYANRTQGGHLQRQFSAQIV
jgi:hypothetical protein